jgi:hypothetical protein
MKRDWVQKRCAEWKLKIRVDFADSFDKIISTFGDI